MQKHTFTTFLLALSTIFVLARSASAETINLMWDPNSEPQVVGYKVHVGTQPGTYTQHIDVGPTTAWSFTSAVAGQQYCFAVTAYVSGTLEGPRSSEVCGYSNWPPALTNPGAQSSTVGEADSLQLAGSDPKGDVLTYSAAGLPPGLTLMVSTGYISGTPTTAGSYSVTARASDGVLTVSQVFTWIVTVADTIAPVVTITGPTSAATHSTTATTMSLSGTASDNTAVARVTWVSSRGGSGTASGSTSWSVPSIALQSGSNVLTVTARDAAGNTSSDVLTVTMNAAPTLASVANQSSTAGLATTLQLTGSDPNGDRLTYSATGLPKGMTLAPATGLMTGTPTTAGTFTVSASVSDGVLNASRSFTWTITAPDTRAPTVAITGPTAAATYTASAATVTLKGTASDTVGVTQVSWVNSRGGSGVATGTTSWSAGLTLQSGSNLLTVTARDAAGNTSTDTLTVTYTAPDTTTPVITITQPTTAATLTTLTSPLTVGGTASDNVGVTRVTWANDRGGSGTATGTTSWSTSGIALKVGVNVLTVTARDAAGNTRSDVLTVTYDPLRVASLTADLPAPQPLGTTITFRAIGTGGDGTYEYQWRVYNGQTWVTKASWGPNPTLVWTPTTATSVYQVRVVVRSGEKTVMATMKFPIVP